MNADRFEEFLRGLRQFAGLWQSAEFAVIAVGDRSGDFLSLATSVVLMPDRVESVNVLRDVRLPDLATPFLAARVQYPLTKALNEWEPLKRLVETGRFTLEVRSNLFAVRLFGVPAGPDDGQCGFSWTKVLDKSRTETKAQFGIDRPCIALLNTYDSGHLLCRLVTDDQVKRDQLQAPSSSALDRRVGRASVGAYARCAVEHGRVPASSHRCPTSLRLRIPTGERIDGQRAGSSVRTRHGGLGIFPTGRGSTILSTRRRKLSGHHPKRHPQVAAGRQLAQRSANSKGRASLRGTSDRGDQS